MSEPRDVIRTAIDDLDAALALSDTELPQRARSLVWSSRAHLLTTAGFAVVVTGAGLTSAEREACERVAAMAENHIEQFKRHWSDDALQYRRDAVATVRALANRGAS